MKILPSVVPWINFNPSFLYMIAAVYISFSNSTDSGVFSSDIFNIWYVVDEHTRILLFSIGKIFNISVATFFRIKLHVLYGDVNFGEQQPIFFYLEVIFLFFNFENLKIILLI